jgi:cystathionine beta-lyase/cystathionine gamma-synthase
VVVHSATKFLNGHHDVLAGAVAGSRRVLEPIAALLVDTGGVADPEAAWLLRRGLRTFALRPRASVRLGPDPGRAPGRRPRGGGCALPRPAEHPDHAVARRILDGGYGAVVPFVVDGGRAAASGSWTRSG